MDRLILILKYILQPEELNIVFPLVCEYMIKIYNLSGDYIRALSIL